VKILELEHVSKRFVQPLDLAGRIARALGAGVSDEVVHAVDDVSFDVNEGEVVGLVGESGCGKSTLGRMVAGILPPSAGAIRYRGQERIGLPVQMIFQDPFASLNPRMTVAETLAEPLMLHRIVPASDRRRRVEELLQLVGLQPHQAARYPHEFSGGQRQRIVIARALAVEPKVIVCDEAVSALDVSIRAQILNLLKDLQARLGLAYVFISHDLGVVKHIADRIAVMYLGRIVETGPAGRVFKDPRHPYTRALLSAIPVASPMARRDRTFLEGDVPSPIDPPNGCSLHTRCPYAAETCRHDRPHLDDDGTGHAAACHFWRELPSAKDILPTEGQVDPRLERLFGAFAGTGP
jgi:oligopeptide/dipeptide ABC transporter ATP-binding protein